MGKIIILTTKNEESKKLVSHIGVKSLSEDSELYSITNSEAIAFNGDPAIVNMKHDFITQYVSKEFTGIAVLNCYNYKGTPTITLYEVNPVLNTLKAMEQYEVRDYDILEKPKSFNYNGDNKSFTINSKIVKLKNINITATLLLSTDNYDLLTPREGKNRDSVYIFIDGKGTPIGMKFYVQTGKIIECGSEGSDEFAMIQMFIDHTEITIFKVDTELPNKVMVIGKYEMEEIPSKNLHTFSFDKIKKKFTVNDKTFNIEDLNFVEGSATCSSEMIKGIRPILKAPKYQIGINCSNLSTYMSVNGITKRVDGKCDFNVGASLITDYNRKGFTGYAIYDPYYNMDNSAIKIVEVDLKKGTVKHISTYLVTANVFMIVTKFTYDDKSDNFIINDNKVKLSLLNQV